MKKLLATVGFVWYSLPGLFGQGYVTVVADAKLAAALMANHAVTLGVLQQMSDAAEDIREDHEDIAAKTMVIRGIRDKRYESLFEVPALVREGKNWHAVKGLVLEIGEYQTEIVRYGRSSPELAAIAIMAASVMAERAAALVEYVVESALTGGDGNLVSSRQRMEILRNVIRELRSIRAMAFAIARRMKTASRASAAGAVHPFKLPYPQGDKALVKNILNHLSP